MTLPSTAEAGPLLDWLFHRNRSQGLSAGCPFGNCLSKRSNPAAGAAGYGGYGAYGANSASGYGNQPAAAATAANSAYGANAANPYGANPQAAAAAATQNPYANTAGYAPQSGCGPGWCQETVVRYVPQIAYRTMYQPVPVTTYKTSTSINPSTGLPRTCTRPCTSYNYQARRVPYTTYRPVYTTVPVTDSWGGAAATTAGYAPQPQAPGYTPTYAYQPPSAAGGCSSCQNSAPSYGGGGGGGYSNWSNVPGYTPGGASLLPPNAARAWPNPATSNYAQATPWRQESSASPWRPEPGYRDSSSGYSDGGYAERSASPGSSSRGYSDGGGYSATPWSSDPGQARSYEPADERPRLRPPYPEEYGESTYRPLKPKPMTEDVRRQLDGETNGGDTSYRYRAQRENYAYSQNQDPGGYFRTPRQQGYTPPPIRPPANQRDRELDSRMDDYYRGGIRAFDPPQTSDWDFGDKTAGNSFRPRNGAEQPLIEESMRTRYAAAPINWPNRPSGGYERDRASHYDGRNNSPVYENNDWTPIR